MMILQNAEDLYIEGSVTLFDWMMEMITPTNSPVRALPVLI